MTDDKLSLEELGHIFGKNIPMEAFELLGRPRSGQTMDQIRARLREIAAENTPHIKAKRSLRDRIWGWVEEHDLRHSEAVTIADEVFAEFKDKNAEVR